MSDNTIVISPKTFRDLSPGDLPVIEIYRQVGDGPVKLYHLADGVVYISSAGTHFEDTLNGRTLEAARTMATVTGSVSATQVDQVSSASDYAFACTWVREDSWADRPVVVSDTDPEASTIEQLRLKAVEALDAAFEATNAYHAALQAEREVASDDHVLVEAYQARWDIRTAKGRIG